MRAFTAAEWKRLETCDPNLQQIVTEAAKSAALFVVEGHRDKDAQERAFRDRKSKLRWPQSRHNKTPSKAVDLAPLDEDGRIAWNDRDGFRGIAAAMRNAAAKAGQRLRWGGDWDGDGDENDERFVDMPHFELVEE